jgi:hypothetical protein
MRWREPEHGEDRTIKRFIFFPTLIDGIWVWWETIYILQFHSKINGWVNYRIVKGDSNESK